VGVPGLTGKFAGQVNALWSDAKDKASGIAAKLRADEGKPVPYTPSADETYVLKLIDEAKRTRLATLEAFEPLWTKAILFCAGVQHLRYISSSRNFEPTRYEDWMPMPVFNFIQAKVQRIIDFFTRNDPTAYIQPIDRTEVNRRAAEIGENVREYLWDFNQEPDNFDEAATWAAVTGNVFKRIYVDGSLKNARRIPKVSVSEEPILDPMTGEIIMGFDGQPVMTPRHAIVRDEMDSIVYEEVPEAEINTYNVGPMAMTVPLASRRLQDAPWLMETTLQPIETLKQLYPQFADHMPKQGTVITSDLYQHRLTSLLTSGLHGVVRSLDPYTMDGFGITHYYERAPSRDFPKGLAVVEMSGLPLYVGELPEGTDYSYNHFGYFRTVGRFWYRGAVEDMIHPQEQINKLEQFEQLNDAFNVNPQTYVPKESGIAEGAIRNKPGKVTRYKYPFKPETTPGMALPPSIIQRRGIYMQDIEEISGVRNVMMGDAPPGVTAGVALNRLGEEAEGMFAPIQRRWETFLERDQTLKLKLVQKFYTIPRYMALNRRSGVTEIKDFVGAQLRGNTTVRIEAGSYRPRSKSGQQQLMIDALQMGLLPGVFTDPEQLREFLVRLGVDGFDPPEGLDTKRAKWENEMLGRMSGYDQVHREPSDNDFIHLTSHNNFQKTDDFRRLPLMMQNFHHLHIAEHLMAVINAEGHDTNQFDPQDEDLEPAGGSGGGGPDKDGQGGGEKDAPGEEVQDAP
jgi:hypothetical protein